jgi:hypothetical protein
MAVQVELWVFLAILAAIIGFGLLTGSVRTTYLLFDRPSGAFSVARLQLLFLSFLIGGYYLMQLSANPGVLPDIPPPVLAVLFASHGVYLLDKSVKSLMGI